MEQEILERLEKIRQSFKDLNELHNESMQKLANLDPVLFEKISKDMKTITESNDLSKIIEIHRQYANNSNK